MFCVHIRWFSCLTRTANWTCPYADYNNSFCECTDCGALEDPDCADAAVRTSCANDFFCANHTCAYPKGWTCGLGTYGDGRACDCGCGVPDPDCVDYTLPVAHCGAGAWSCVAGTCRAAYCGNGRVDYATHEECEHGGVGCNSSACRCAHGFYKNGTLGTVSCVARCGDGIVVPALEQCDMSSFCVNTTCLCAHGHPLNTTTGLCTGCGNNILEDGEECDGSPFCTKLCVCRSGYHAVPGNSCQKSADLALLLLLWLAIPVVCILIIVPIVYYRRSKKHLFVNPSALHPRCFTLL